MEAKSLQEIRAVAGVHAKLPHRETMSRREQLERWAAALERRAGQRLRPLERIEFLSSRERWQLRADDSPLTVAFQDEALRADGLESDRLGDAMRFFGLSEQQAHLILCDCHYGGTVQASEAARRVRRIAAPTEKASKPMLALWGLGLGLVPVAALVLSAL